ncbi:NUMOD4 domain-containing protein [Neobacillus niacini]|uniref:NUMOD4 domain-containing protein n=1 Tax=Neobacillus niacini TaxID=86668 RepID=UPI0030022C8A
MRELFGLKEEWKDIEGYEGKYQVSNFGDVKSLKKDRLLKQSEMNNGYLKVSLSKDGKSNAIPVHRLVAEAFITRIEGKDQIDHTDGDKKNNTIFNLGWVDYEGNHLMRSTPIKAIHLETGKEEIFLGMGQAARELGLHKQNINKVLKGRQAQTKGYVFKNTVGYIN